MSRETIDSFRKRASRVIDITFGGEHHVCSLKWIDHTLTPYCEFRVYGELASWDYDGLTRLVVAAHDECVRAAVVPKMRDLGVILSDRVRNHADSPLMLAHPTLEDHLKLIRHDIDIRGLAKRMDP
jgi:hypothetical protein